MHTLTFYPLGNADSCLINLANGKKLLFDFGNECNPADQSDKRIDLAAYLLKDLEDAGRDYYDVVAFTHLDADHIRGATEFFWLDHNEEYQSQGRIKIKELWVPAAAIVQDNLEDEEARVLQAEAQYRLLRNEGIRVFSRPDKLDAWLEEHESDLTDDELVIDAGNIVPTFDLEEDNVEFFVHSPFAEACEGKIEDRNEGCLVFQVVFRCGQVDTRIMLTDDTKCENLAAIVRITEAHQAQYEDLDRLGWDVLRIPHHCSYLSLNVEGQKGTEVTEPLPDIKRLYEDHIGQHALLISTSNPILSADTTQPPHFQAASYYKGLVEDPDQQFVVTMEHPTEAQPQPLVITIDELGATIQPATNSEVSKASQSGNSLGSARATSSSPAPNHVSATLTPTGMVQIKAEVFDQLDGPMAGVYPSNGYVLAKGKWLRFTIVNEFANVLFTRRWRVENHGWEATQANCLAYTIDGERGISVRRVTAYTGSHYLICELVHDGRVIASAQHVVSIG